MTPAVRDRDALLRVNFLHQAAHLMLATNPGQPGLIRFLSHTQRSVCRRLVLRRDPSVKRCVCKKCFSLLVPGITSKVRQRKRQQRFTTVTCVACGTSKKFLNRPDYCLWVDKEEAQLSVEKADKPSVHRSAETNVEATSARSSQEKCLGVKEPGDMSTCDPVR
ncbi:ribonuclease P protein subunit p21 isoform X1 [Leucoraja erinacea]|uniref:ribonuclease P protein subunit p21 isoform X1 n=1 Tax=Leucoraja erinaceus TaxID=7782 RepID=UPI0024563F0A|nr:ribonuclease P protein subunit p21 isoform X1 [Leucoraja erinacea]